MHELDEQIRELVDSGAPPVTAREAIEALRSGPMSAHRVRLSWRAHPYAVGAFAMAAAVIVLLVVLVIGFKGTTTPAGVTSTHPGPGGTLVAYLVPDAPASASQLQQASAVITSRLRESGQPESRVKVSGRELIVTTSADAKKARSVLSGLLAQGILLFRPVLCAGPPYSASSNGGSAANSALPVSCPARYQLSATNLDVNVDSGSAQANVAPWPALSRYRSTPSSNDLPGATVLLSTGPNSGAPGERMLVGPAKLGGSGIQSAQALYSAADWQVDLKLTRGGASAWNALALRQFHAYIAVDYDGSIISVPLTEPSLSTFASFADTVEISAGFTRQTATALARDVQSGTLPVPFSISK
jgi:preprotein translocase subunit SecD